MIFCHLCSVTPSDCQAAIFSLQLKMTRQYKYLRVRDKIPWIWKNTNISSYCLEICSLEAYVRGPLFLKLYMSDVYFKRAVKKCLHNAAWAALTISSQKVFFLQSWEIVLLFHRQRKRELDQCMENKEFTVTEPEFMEHQFLNFPPAPQTQVSILDFYASNFITFLLWMTLPIPSTGLQ